MRIRRSATQATINTYSCNLLEFCCYYKNKKLSNLTFLDIEAYADALGKKEVSQKTIKNKLTILRSFIRFLYSRDLTDIRAERIELPRIVMSEANFLEPEEVDKLVDACESKRDKALLLTLVRTGARVSELCDAYNSDIYKRSFIIRCGKGNKPRTTFLTKDAEEAINEYRKTLKTDSIYLFPNQLGNRMSRQMVARIVSNAAKKAKIAKTVSPHTLRHTFATMLLRNGARIEDVQPMLGHSNIATTRLYLHFTNEYLHSRYDMFLTEKV